MRKLTLLLLLALSMPAQANTDPWFESNKPVMCGPFQNIVRTLMRDQFKELPLWIGQSSEDATQFSLFVNAERGNWTLVQYGQEIGCILGIGKTGNIVNLTPFRAQQ